MKAVAFAPGHITGFFEPVYSKDLARTGSRGAGVNISLGAISEVNIAPSTYQNIQIFVNGRKSLAPVTSTAVKYLIGKTPLNIVVKIRLELPTGQGFGMSGAGALSTSLALTKIVDNLSSSDALRVAHYAEIQNKTGLGDVISSWFGGVEIRKEPGLPPWGIIEHIPGQFELVLCVIGKKIDTKKILLNQNLTNKISEYGRLYTKKILENPSIENFFIYSNEFSIKSGLANENVLKAINTADKFGIASMCMLGNSVFAVGKTNELCKFLSNFGKIYLCIVDEGGARILQ